MGISKPFNWVLFIFLVLSRFVAQTAHGRMKLQGEDLFDLYKSKIKQDSGIGTSSLEAIEHGNEPKVDPQVGLKEKDMIKSLPGQPSVPVNFSQYGGYVTVNNAAGRAFYYYFVEARHSKESLPLLLWLNGGPGCSSIGYGAMLELGPFRVHSDGKTLYENIFSWNNATNVLFLESPAGVGFSYSNTTSDYGNNGDTRTAEENYVFLVNWLERFPEYKNRDFYISGESYAGHYVPQLALTILSHNQKANKTIINLKGISIGNAAIDDGIDERGMYDYYANHGVISDQLAYQIQNYCDFSPNVTDQSKECNTAKDAANNITHNIDIYNIYAPFCTSPNLTPQPKTTSIMQYDPCSEHYVYGYMNRPDVQEALHANVTKLTHDWEMCSDVINNWVDRSKTVLPLLMELVGNGTRVWIYSGDLDGRVPITSAKYAIKEMKLQVKALLRPWFVNGEVGGYTEVYEGDLTFAIVREAGHQVPSYQPVRALSLIQHFLDGTPLPATLKSN